MSFVENKTHVAHGVVVLPSNYTLLYWSDQENIKITVYAIYNNQHKHNPRDGTSPIVKFSFFF